MKKWIVGAVLFLFGAAIGFEIAWFLGYFRVGTTSTRSSHSSAVELTLTAAIDGSDRFVFTWTDAFLEHRQWSPPKKVILNGAPWVNLSAAPDGWAEWAKNLDLPSAHITNRTGRDTIALEREENGFSLYFADTQMGAGEYSVTVSIPRR